MKIRLIAVSKGKNKLADGWSEEYISRLRRYSSFELVVIKPIKMTGEEAQQSSDTAAIIRKLKPGEMVVLLDERGESATSPDLSKWLSNQMNKGTKSVSFVIGGAYGVDDSFEHYVNMKLSLSKLTLPHELAKVVFLEQLYRVFTIIHNEKYHH